MTQIDIEKTTDETLPPEKLNGMILVANGKDRYGGIEKILVPMADCYFFRIDKCESSAYVSFLTAFVENGFAARFLYPSDNEGPCRSVLCGDIASCADCERLTNHDGRFHPSPLNCGRLSFGSLICRLEKDPEFVSFDRRLSLDMVSNAYQDLRRYLDTFFFDECIGIFDQARVICALRHLLASERIRRDGREGQDDYFYMRKDQIFSISLPDNGTKLSRLWSDHRKHRGRREGKLLRELSEYVNGATVNFKSGAYFDCNRFEAQELIVRLANEGWKPF